MQTILLIGGILVMTMLISTAQCVGYRHWLILDQSHPMKVTARQFTIAVLVSYAFFNGMIAFAIATMPVECGPNQPNLARIIQMYPDMVFLSSLTDICSLYTAPAFPPYIMINSMTILFYEVIIFAVYSLPTCTFIIIHSFLLLDGRSVYMSEKTRQMHKQYLVLLIQGMLVPMLLIAIPLVFFAYVLVTKTFVPQALLNFLWSLMFAHTFVCSLNILFTSKHYRATIMNFMRRHLRR
ncbi:unnamed protein product, partial [Mesorhabditis belari]|uniref:G protein-coupled receptor n=1 Tax=Mesorhabditis belari TaxID=2138241 RepID=A0AAF3F8R3_9BILA